MRLVLLTATTPAPFLVQTPVQRIVLDRTPRYMGCPAHVFPERDPHVLSRSFARLVQRLGDLKFHDLRHDAASTLTMAGVGQRAVMAMLELRDPRLSLRYQHLTPEHLADAARALDTRPHQPWPSGTIWAPA